MGIEMIENLAYQGFNETSASAGLAMVLDCQCSDPLTTH